MAIDTVKVTVNGTTVTATANGDGTYTATLAAPNVTSYNVNSGHYYPVTVVATNKAGTATTVNDQTENIGQYLRLRVRELTAPTIVITAPTGGQYFGVASPSITFTLTDDANGSGVAINTLKIMVDNKTYTNTSSGVTVTTTSNGYSVTCVPTALTDGTHTLKISVEDNDGNSATSTSITFITDTIAPTLSVSNPATNGTFVSSPSLNVVGTTSDSTSGTPTVTISVNGNDQGTITVSNGAFNKTVTLINGSNTIVVTATDKAGRTTTITRTVSLDSSVPVVASVLINPNPVNIGENYIVTIQVTG